ncbi:MAG: hypothetical protein ACR2QF_16165 [Geminicoccaceae bacterium]
MSASARARARAGGYLTVAVGTVVSLLTMSAVAGAKDGFLMPDPRPDTPIAEPCMTDCEAPSKVVGKARIFDVTPDQEGESSLVD